MAFARLLPHEELLVAILRRSIVPDELRDQVRLLNDPALQSAFRRHAGEHGVLGLALTVLQRSPELAAALSEATAAALFAPLSLLRRQAALWDLECERVLRHLQSGGVDPILLKGGALRMTTYRDSTERPIGDLDLLVDEREMDAAIAALESAKYTHAYGDMRAFYRAHHFHYIMRHPGGFAVELHWDLTPPSAQVRLDPEAFRARAVRLDDLGAARVPSPEDMVLHLICQNLEDGFGKLRRIMDVDRIIGDHGGFDWSYLVAAVERGNAQTAAALTLQLCRRLLGTDLPRANAANLFVVPRAARLGLAAVRPVIVHAHRFERGHDLRRTLLTLWAVRGAKSWWWALGRRLFAEHYRFSAVLNATPPPPLWRRAEHVAKLLAFQVWSYAAAAAGLMTRPGRAALRFWKA